MDKIFIIQYLRAFAAISVVGSHTFWGFGAEGVDLFFVISGFIMFYVIDMNPDKTSKSFFLDRYFRIAPMYYLFTIIFVILGFVSIESFHQVIQSLSFIKYYETSPLLSIGWTLEYEFVFYTICAMSIFLFKDFYSRLFFVFVILIFAVLLIDFSIYSEKKYGHFAEFAFGIIVYLLFRAKTLDSINKMYGYFGIFISLLSFTFSNIYYKGIDDFLYLRFVGFGVPSLLILISFLIIKRDIKFYKFLNYLGDASYSIYITHTTTLYSLYALTGSNRSDSLLVDITSFFIAILIGCIAHSYLEAPITRKIKQYRFQKLANL